MKKYFPLLVKSINMVFIAALISGCMSENKEYVSIPVLEECRGFADDLVNDVKNKSDYSVELRKFSIKPMSHEELYGYLNIYTSIENIYNDLEIEINTFEAYCYSDTSITLFSNYIVDEVEKEIDTAISSAYRENNTYVKVNDGQLKIFVNKLDAN